MIGEMSEKTQSSPSCKRDSLVDEKPSMKRVLASKLENVRSQRFRPRRQTKSERPAPLTVWHVHKRSESNDPRKRKSFKAAKSINDCPSNASEKARLGRRCE